MEQARKHELLTYLVDYLVDERQRTEGNRIAFEETGSTQDLWELFRALVNTRQPLAATDDFFAAQDELLQGLITEAGITKFKSIVPCAGDPRLRLWRGDITTLEVDAIVNAANSQMLGCWVPGHYCIDNAIHTFAGVQLRLACNELMQAQGHEEPTAQAKVTRAFNLPSKFVIHTVGPIAAGNPTPQHRKELAQCYRACLDGAAEAGCASIAFCCISTGVFGFPQQEAARIALDSVSQWLFEHSEAPQVVFNVFGEADEKIYQDLLA